MTVTNADPPSYTTPWDSTQRKDLGVTTIAAGQQLTDTSQHKTNNQRNRPNHDRGSYRQTTP